MEWNLKRRRPRVDGRETTNTKKNMKPTHPTHRAAQGRDNIELEGRGEHPPGVRARSTRRAPSRCSCSLYLINPYLLELQLDSVFSRAARDAVSNRSNK